MIAWAPATWFSPRTGGGLARLILLLMALLGGVTLLFSPILWDVFGNVRVHGRLVDAATGEAIAGARVAALERLPRPRDRRPPAASREEVTTDADGRFDLTVRAQGGGNGGILSRLLGSPRLPSHQDAKALRVRWPDGRERVIDLTPYSWQVEGDTSLEGTYATISVGDLAVESAERPAPPSDTR